MDLCKTALSLGMNMKALNSNAAATKARLYTPSKPHDNHQVLLSLKPLLCTLLILIFSHMVVQSEDDLPCNVDSQITD